MVEKEALVSYAYSDGSGKLEISVGVRDGLVEMCFVDKGISYSPLDHEDPDISLSLEGRPIGGLGIYLMKDTMDEVSKWHPLRHDLPFTFAIKLTEQQNSRTKVFDSQISIQTNVLNW